MTQMQIEQHDGPYAEFAQVDGEPGERAVRVPAERALTPIQIMAHDLTELAPRFDAALQRAIPTDYFIRVALNEMQRNPDILRCTKASILLSLMNAAQLRLPPDGLLGLAYLIPYKGTCTLIVGAQGLMELARRSGVARLKADLVYEMDEFEWELGTTPFIKHKPDLVQERDDMHGTGVIAGYAIAWFPDGNFVFDVMTRDQIEYARKTSKTDKVWGVYWAEMARKTLMRRLAKSLPKTGDFANAIALESSLEEGDPQPQFFEGDPVVEVDPPVTRTEEVRRKLGLGVDAE